MKVLVAVDKNPETFTGLEFTCHLLENKNAVVDAIHVKPDLADIVAEGYAPFLSKGGLEGEIEGDVKEVKRQFEDACKSCLSARIPCKLLIEEGDPAEEILNTSESEQYDMIVLGSHEESYLRGFLLGAVHAKILHNAEQPVLIVRQFREIQRVLIVYRGSETDKAALDFVAPLLSGKSIEITLLHVQETGQYESEEFASQSLQQGAQALRKFDFEPITKMSKGDFVEQILRDVAVHRYDLVVLGAYGHKRPKYMKLLSDEALNLARLTTRPILVFREKSTS
ncbi:MAG: universal stress protein [Deltaproteobacteria bacterium]|nr:universal stress protein [Deltaproteobacteria bacterium]